ncbi:MAG: WbqC family protein [Burkholderiales bacterium]|nr:WbqC family protein [Burkholderiales bacterium]
MKVAIMQPYFLPYIGYFQLMQAVDVFVVYDRIKYTKKGWINRNRFLLNGADATFSLPLRKGSDALDVVERELAADFDRPKLLAQFAGAYRRAPQFESTFALLERIVQHRDDNLFRFIHHSLQAVCAHLAIETEIRTSSSIAFDNELRGQDKVLAICEALDADCYRNPIGGTELYAKPDFAARGIELQFLKARPFEYPQFGAPFVPWLSIVDVLMFNPLEVVRDRLEHGYDLV